MTAPALLRPPDWTTSAACQGIAGPDLDPWHPPEHLTATEQAAQHALARLVCARCPVRHPCAVEALQAGIGHGVWGGLTVADRRRIARRHGYPQPGAAVHGTYARYVSCTDGPDGGRCVPCLRAKQAYVADRRAKGLEGRTIPAVVVVLAEPHGRGRRAAWPGQILLPGADTRGLRVAA